ncbi:senescence marker protein-30 [Corynebacterium deserti GIMN1.010]|uniref:Senescence marker protein-30 n=1 Tax=Corynebacterium deserti GIMN1.010 TaxID=931089 RepID=A0A0M3QAD7_9CORY|nr:senescence marker protein-30 [Corynebacterium deserti GIMN1.010]
MQHTIDVLLDVKTTLGEGPIWDEASQRLFWIDSGDGRIFRSTAEGTELRAWEVGEQIGSMALFQDGSAFLAALKTGLFKVDIETGEKTLLNAINEGKDRVRLNDGKVDRQGRFIVGSMDMLEDDPLGELYSYASDGTLSVLDKGIICSNGPCFSPDGQTLYFSDTWAGEIWKYDYDPATGTASNRSVFAKVDTSEGGVADGATVDSEGFLWQALVYSGKIVRYDPDGNIDRSIDMPVLKATSLSFGGPDLDTLFVTSMAKPPLPRFPEDGQLRGSLFAVRGLGVTGIAEPRFGMSGV